MPTVALTDIAIKALQLPENGQVTYWDESLSGFGVRVSPGGTKAFVLVHGAERRRTTIGRYPLLSLREARTEAKRLIAEKTLGLDSRKGDLAFADARDQFLEACKERNRLRTIEDYRRKLDRHFRFGKRKLSEIGRADIQQRLKKLRATPSEQHHAFVAARSFFNWAFREQLIDQSPMAGTRPPKLNPPRERVLTDSEIGEVLKAAAVHSFPFGPIFRLLALTGQRRGEIAALEWEWIDRKNRTISLPAALTKNGRSHTFPYGDKVADVLEELPELGPYLFPARTEAATIFNGWGKCKARLDATLKNVEPYVLHDLRRTFSSNMARLGTPIHVTEKLLNHVTGTVSGVAAVYNRYSYMDEMRQAITRYDEFLVGLLKE